MGKIHADNWSVAAVAAVAILAGSGLGFRSLARLYQRQVTAPLIAPGTFLTLPLELGRWQGADVPLKEAVVRATDTQDHVNRSYQRSDGAGMVSLFIGYSFRPRDLFPHRPEVCYPGAGWSHKDTTRRRVAVPFGDMPVQIHEFRKGMLADQRIAVLNYYVIDGSYFANVEDLRDRAWKPSAQARYVVQVQIAAVPYGQEMTPEEMVVDFARASAQPIHDLVATAVRNAEAAKGDVAQ